MDSTVTQFTSDITIDVPIVAKAVCAIVLTALIPAAFNHFLSIMISSFLFYESSMNLDLRLGNTIKILIKY